jgi:4-hydroxy-3-methylbut-2-en-1-yl diphosphate synthase IspG/GcpE
MVGNVPMGSDHPIRIQTMTTSDTKDVAKTVEEVRAPYLICMRGCSQYCLWILDLHKSVFSF